jgi:hypothetical protein
MCQVNTSACHLLRYAGTIAVRKPRPVLNDSYVSSVAVNYSSQKCTETRRRVSEKKIHQHRQDKHQAMKQYTGGEAPCFRRTVIRQTLMTFSRLWFMLRAGWISKPVSEWQQRNKSWLVPTGYFFLSFPPDSTAALSSRKTCAFAGTSSDSDTIKATSCINCILNASLNLFKSSGNFTYDQV